MLLRIITGLTLAPITLAGIWFAESWILVACLGVVSAVGSYELTSLASNSIEKSKPSAWQVIGTLLISCGAYAAWVLCSSQWHLPIVAGSLILFAMMHMKLTASLEDSGAWILWSMVGVVWVAGSMALGASIIHETPPQSVDRAVFITVLLVVWLGDSGAYFVGRFMGKRKLAPILSPNKTIEGAIGGVIASVAGIFIAQHLMGIPGSVEILIGFALVGGIVEQAGDLFESLLKRIAGVKDSGNVFPGHGGMLDRIDGLLFAFPLFALFWFLVA